MNKNTFKKLCALGLCMVMFVCSLGSCGGDTTTVAADDTTAGAENSTVPAVTEAVTTYEEADIPESDFDGAEFRILYPNWSLYNNYYFADENTGDVMNDAIYKRTSDIEERVNVDITTYCPGIITTIVPEVQKTVLAGDDTYSLVLTHCREGLLNLLSGGLCYNLHDIPNIDMSKSYWNSEVKNIMDVNGTMIFAANKFIIPDISICYFNKDMAESFSLESPYELVLDGKWTLDKMYEMAQVAAADLDGNGEYTVEDRFGYCGINSSAFITNPLVASNCEFVRKQSDNTFVLDFDVDRIKSFSESLLALFNDKQTSYLYDYKQEYDPNIGNKGPTGIYTGRVLFEFNYFCLTTLYRSVDISIGIVPIPKYSESDELVTLTESGFMCVPAVISNPDMTGTVMELLGAENNKTVMPVFYEQTLNQKLARDEESIAMLELIFDNSRYSLNKILNLTIAAENLENVASFYESKKSTWQSYLDQYNDGYANYGTK